MRLNDGESGLDRAMAALAHPARRAILEHVMRGEFRITDLSQPFAMSLNAVSKHIRVLERAHLVRRRRAWREHLVSFEPTGLRELTDWMEKNACFKGCGSCY